MRRKLVCFVLILSLIIGILASPAALAITNQEASQELQAEELLEPIDEEKSDGAVVPFAANPSLQNGGIYNIKNVNSGKYLNVDGGVDRDQVKRNAVGKGRQCGTKVQAGIQRVL